MFYPQRRHRDQNARITQPVAWFTSAIQHATPYISSFMTRVMGSEVVNHSLQAIARYLPGYAAPQPSEPWYKLRINEAGYIFMAAQIDFVWAYTSRSAVNYRYEATDDFIEQSLAQLFWPTVVVALTTPLTAAALSGAYKKPFKLSFIHAALGAITNLISITPWNFFAKFGVDFFKSLGYSLNQAQHLSVLFPGPGTIEGLLSGSVYSLLRYGFDPDFKFESIRYLIDMSPMNFVPGNTWLVTYNVMSETGINGWAGTSLQALAVASVGLGVNYLAIRASHELSERIKAHRANQAALPVVARQSGSPIYTCSPIISMLDAKLDKIRRCCF